MLRTVTVCFFVFGLIAQSYSQSNSNWRLYSGSNQQKQETYNEQGRFYSMSGVRVIQSQEIIALSDRFIEEHTKNPTIQGFRVQVFLGERAQANEIANEFNADHEEIRADVTYLAPNFRVRVGAFRSQIEAEYYLEKIKHKYSNSYVVPDKVLLSELDK